MRSIRMTMFTTVAVAAAVGVVGVAPALALPPSDKVADTLTFVGSDTTQYFDQALCAAINSNTKLDNPKPATGAKDTCVNVKAFVNPGDPTSVTAPADAFAGACTWFITPSAAPAGASCSGTGQETSPVGSGAGAARLELNPAGDASVDVSRASSYQCNTTTRINLECYNYARDAVGYATKKGATVKLTLAQIQGIYNCSITNWSQVTGAGTGVIERFFPQAGSGTGSFFVANFLNGVDPRLSTSCPATQIEENDGTKVTANGIVPFSAGSWIAQGNAATPDVRNGTTIGKVQVNTTTFTPVSGITTFTPNLAAFKEGSLYPGARYIYHNIDNRSNSYLAAKRFVGFDAGSQSKLCAGAFASTLKTFGFLPLAKQATSGACRLNVAA